MARAMSEATLVANLIESHLQQDAATIRREDWNTASGQAVDLLVTLPDGRQVRVRVTEA